MAADPNGGNGIGSLSDYNTDDSVTVKFSLYFNIAKCAAWWSLWLFAGFYALLRRKIISRAWFIYTALLFIICFNGIQCSAYVGYASHALKGHTGLVGYLLYLFFFNVSRSMFLAVLLVIASGYCITRSDFGPHKQHVVFVPTAVLITGLITDFSFFALASSPDADTYNLGDMNTLVASMWFVCAVLNLAALILAWLYLFEALSREVASLELEHKRRTGQATEEIGAANPFTDAYTPLGRGPATKAPATAAASSSVADPEAGGEGDGQTVADHLAYTAKKLLLSRFSLGVSSYLLAEISVVLMPLFINYILQSTLQVLQFVFYIIFMIVLLIIFRPQEQSKYLMIGFSEEDAEERGVSHLLTGISMEAPAVELGATDNNANPQAAAVASTSSSSRPLAGPGPSATVQPSRASRKAEVDSERYRQIPSAPPPSTMAAAAASAGNQFGALPVNTPGSGVAPPPTRVPRRGPQPRARPPTSQTAVDTGPFVLCSDDEDGDDDAAHPLTRGGKGKGF